MRKFLLVLFSLFLTVYIVSAQKFSESKEYKLTKFDHSLFEKSNRKGQIYITDSIGTKLKEITVFEFYENIDEITETTETKLTNIRKVIKLRIDYCACHCNTSKYYWLITNKNKWIQLPTIEEMDMEIDQKRKNYVFSKNKQNTIELYEYKYEMTEKNTKENGLKFTKKSEKILKTFIWNGENIKELK